MILNSFFFFFFHFKTFKKIQILSNERLEKIQLIRGKKSTLDEKSLIFEIKDENSKVWALRMIAIRLTDDNLLK